MKWEQIATSLKIRRISQGRSRKEVCAAAGLTEHTLYKFEQGKSSVTLDSLLALLPVLGIRIELQYDDPQDNPEQALADAGYTGDL